MEAQRERNSPQVSLRDCCSVAARLVSPRDSRAGLEPCGRCAHATAISIRWRFAPSVAAHARDFWRDNTGALHLLSPHDDIGDPFMAPSPSLTRARLIANSRGIWRWARNPGALHCYEPETLTELVSVELTGFRLVDLAYLDCSVVGVLALTPAAGTFYRSIAKGASLPTLARLPAITPSAARTCAARCSCRADRRRAPVPFLVHTRRGAPKRLWPRAGDTVLQVFLYRRFRPHLRRSASDGQDAVVVLGPDGGPVDLVPVGAADAPITGLARPARVSI